ncbi:hypothetical protein ACFW04_012561 [Cataglyphis niger]
MCHAKENWIEILPTVLLGLRICFKEDLNASPAKMLYGSTKNFRDDTVRKSLQPPYSGPFRVVERINDYLFTIDISGKIVNSTTDRLKSAFLPKEIDTDLAFTTPLTPSDPFTSTSSGKQLKTYSGPKKKVKFAT